MDGGRTYGGTGVGAPSLLSPHGLTGLREAEEMGTFEIECSTYFVFLTAFIWPFSKTYQLSHAHPSCFPEAAPRAHKLCPPSFDEVSNGHGNHLPPRAPRDSQKDSIRSPQRARMHPPNFKGAVTRDVEGKASAWRRRGHPSFSYVIYVCLGGQDTSGLAPYGSSH